MSFYYRKPSNQPSERKSTTITAADAMKELLKSLQLDRKFKEQKVIHSWEEIMGPTIAKRTGKRYVSHQKLFVEITSAPLKAELSASRGKVLAHIHHFLGEPFFHDIVFI